jgi:KAP family P-loop domain
MASEVAGPPGDGGRKRGFSKQERQAPVSADEGAPETEIGEGEERTPRPDEVRASRERGQGEKPPPPPVPPPRERIDIAALALADQWSAEDLLGFSDYATALADLIEDARTIKPLTIGIDAPWGMGKTTLMHMIDSRLKEDRPHAPPLPTVWFNAWTYDKDEALWAALALEILRKVREGVINGG